MKGLFLTITQLGRGFSARKVRTVTRTDRKTGDTIRVQQTYYDTEAHQFRGSFERVGGRWRLHISNRWMAQSGFNTYDNTARMHYPLLPSFDTPDPLSQDYPHLSPYSHCAGNPLSLIDPTGMFIIGGDKKHIEYDESKHTLVGNLTEIQKTALTPMLLTNTGTQKLLEMLNISYEIKLRNEVTFEPKAASTRAYTKKNESTGKKEFDYVIIEFYRDNIEGDLNKDPMYNETGLTDNERWGAVATHEACHALYKEANREFEPSWDKREDIARKYERQYIDEIKKNREKMKTKLIIAFILFQFVGARASEDICLNAVKATYAGLIYNPFCARIYEEFFRGDYQLEIDIYDFSKKPKDGKYRDWEFFQDVYMGRDKYNFQDSIGVYMIFGSCSDPADGVNVIKDGSLVWYYYRDNGASQMRSITMLMDFFKKYRHKYSKGQMLYIIAGFTINNDGRNLFSSEKRSDKIEELLSDSFLSKYAPQRAIDLLDGNKEVSVADMANKSLALIRYNTTHLIFVDNYISSFYLSKNNPRYQFTYLQRACLYYIRKRITAEQFMNVLNALVDDNQNLYNGEDIGEWWRNHRN